MTVVGPVVCDTWQWLIAMMSLTRRVTKVHPYIYSLLDSIYLMSNVCITYSLILNQLMFSVKKKFFFGTFVKWVLENLLQFLWIECKDLFSNMTFLSGRCLPTSILLAVYLEFCRERSVLDFCVYLFIYIKYLVVVHWLFQHPYTYLSLCTNTFVNYLYEALYIKFHSILVRIILSRSQANIIHNIVITIIYFTASICVKSCVLCTSIISIANGGLNSGLVQTSSGFDPSLSELEVKQ